MDTILRRLVLIFLLLLVASPASAAIAFVNSATAGANNVLSVTATITTTAGNDVIACITASSSSLTTFTSVTDTGGSTYTQRAVIANGANVTAIWSARNVAASTSVTANIAVSQRLVLVVLQYSGVAALGLTATNTGSSVAPSVSLTTQDNNNFVVAALGDVGGTETITANVGTLRNSKGTGTAATGVSVAGVDNTSATPAAVTSSDTLSISNAWAAVALELRTVAPPAANPSQLPTLGCCAFTGNLVNSTVQDLLTSRKKENPHGQNLPA